MESRDEGQDTGNLAGIVPRGERRPGLRPLAAAAARIAAPIVARHGGGVLARLKAEWGAVAGPELAALTWPEGLGRGGALKLRVMPGFALELQHRAPLALERINRFFGRAAVTRIVLVQGPLPLPGAAPRPAAPPLTGGEARELDSRLATVADPELRAALAGLGALVLRSSGGRPE